MYHYKEKGIGKKSELSKNTIITPRLIKNTLDRYVELGGSVLDFIANENDAEEYKNFMEEIEAC